MENQVAAKAAKIWTDTLRDGFSPNSGNDEIDKLAAEFRHSNRIPLSYETIAAFEEFLKDKIAKLIMQHESVQLHTDYEPKDLFAEIVDEFDETLTWTFPIKSRMNIYPDRIIYKFGYTGKVERWMI